MTSSLQPRQPEALRPSQAGQVVEMHDATGLSQRLGFRCPVFLASKLWGNEEEQGSAHFSDLRLAVRALLRIRELVNHGAPASARFRQALLEGTALNELSTGHEPDSQPGFQEFLRQTLAGARTFSFDGRWLAFDLEDRGQTTALTANLSLRVLGDGRERIALLVSPWDNTAGAQLLELLSA